MFLILTYDEYDSQSSKKAWQVWFPYKERGYSSREAAEAEIARTGSSKEKYWIVEVGDSVTPGLRVQPGRNVGIMPNPGRNVQH